MTCTSGFCKGRTQTGVGHDLLAPPGEAAGHSARLDPPRFIPADPEEVGAPLHRALAEHMDGEALEESRELVPWFRPGDADLFRAVGGGLHARHVGHNPGGELTRVQVRPAPGFLVIPGGPGLTLGKPNPCAPPLPSGTSRFLLDKPGQDTIFILKIHHENISKITTETRQGGRDWSMTTKVSKSKKAIVYENLKRRIITNSLQPGEPLNEGVLSKELKTSKTPIREAIQQLEKEGLIENVPGRGAFVSRISVEDILEVFEIREILECAVIRRVAAKEELNVAEAEAVRKRFESSEADENKTPRSSFRPGDQIHAFVFEAFGNKRLLEYYRRLLDHIERMRLYFFSQLRPERSEQSSLEHLEIVNALIGRDPKRAENAMRAHLRNATDYLKRII